MNRYFIEVGYHGKDYAGFQIQKNALTIQEEVEKALEIFFRTPLRLTGSSRTDTGVHALQNFFHFDFENDIDTSSLYNLNAILPVSIVIKKLVRVKEGSHSRFDALSREYTYFLHQNKEPFKAETSFYYPYAIQRELLDQAAEIVKKYTSFASFSKRSTQVKTFDCSIIKSEWVFETNSYSYHVEANRFLRGMVRGLVATMLQVGRKKISIENFEEIIVSNDSSRANFAAPGHGLFLIRVRYPDDYFYF